MRLSAITLLCALLAFPAGLWAQTRFNNQWSIHASGGYVMNNGFNVSAGAEKTLDSPVHSIGGEVTFQSRGFTTDTSIPEDFEAQDYLLRISYTYTLEEPILNHLYIGFSGGAIGGYEVIQEDLKTSALTEKDKFVYGGSVCVKAEYGFVRKLAVFIAPQVTYTTSNFKKLTFNPVFGIKYYL